MSLTITIGNATDYKNLSCYKGGHTNMTALRIKYPTGEGGWFAFMYDSIQFAYWDVNALNWKPFNSPETLLSKTANSLSDFNTLEEGLFSVSGMGVGLYLGSLNGDGVLKQMVIIDNNIYTRSFNPSEIVDDNYPDFTSLNVSLSNEAEARSNADNMLQQNITSEAQARTAADNTLQQNITSEAQARALADIALQEQIDSKSDLENTHLISGTKLKVVSSKKIPDQFFYNPNMTTPQPLSFCVGGYDYLLVQNTWPNEAEVGGRVFWINNNNIVNSAKLTTSGGNYKMSKVAWSNFTDSFEGGVVVAGQHMYEQTWIIAVLNGSNGSLVTHYAPPSGDDVENAITALCVYQMRTTAHSRVFLACDNLQKIYSFKLVDGSDVRYYDYPTGVTSVKAMCIDDWGLLFLSDGGNDIHYMNCMGGELISTFTVPRKTSGGISLNNNNLVVLDQSVNTIFEISLGGIGILYNNNVIKNMSMSKLFNKVANTVIGGEPNVIYENNKFRMWFSRGELAYCESNDGITFNTPVTQIPYAGRSHVFKIDNNYYVYYVDVRDYTTIRRAESLDGITWTNDIAVLTASEIAANCPNWSAIEQIGNVFVLFENNTYKLLVEVIANYSWSVGYMSSENGVSDWYFHPNNPTVVNHIDPLASIPYATKSIGRPKLFYKDALNRYWFTAHISQTESLPTRIGLFWSYDLIHLNPVLCNPILDFTAIEEVDQLSDAWCIEVDGKIYIYYSAVVNFGGDNSYIKVAKLDMTSEEFVSLSRLD